MSRALHDHTPKRQLVEAVNGAPLLPIMAHNISDRHPSDEKLLAWLRARAGYWEREGYTMLHANGLMFTGYNAATGNRVVITVAEVEGAK